MSRFETIASISRRLSAGTTTSSACAGVTTPPIVWIASCCTVPSTGAVSRCRPVLRAALIRSWSQPGRLGVGLDELVGEACAVLGNRLGALFAQRLERRLGLLLVALLDQQLLLRWRPDPGLPADT